MNHPELPVGFAQDEIKRMAEGLESGCCLVCGCPVEKLDKESLVAAVRVFQDLFDRRYEKAVIAMDMMHSFVKAASEDS